jgi:hypothetical protein
MLTGVWGKAENAPCSISAAYLEQNPINLVAAAAVIEPAGN